jgi:hypothetical protein
VRPLNACLDTCIVSGITKQDLKPEQQKAILKLLEYRKNGIVSIVTFKIAKDEIEKIPEEYRYKHQAIYLLIADVPVCRTVTIHGRGLMGMGMGMGTGAGTIVPDPLYKALKKLLPDEQDAKHVYQASKNNIQYFLTTDEQTILLYSDKILEISEVMAISPVEFYNLVTNASQ